MSNAVVKWIGGKQFVGIDSTKSLGSTFHTRRGCRDETLRITPGCTGCMYRG